MAEYIDREAVLRYLKERGEYELNSVSPYGMIISHVIEVLARDIEDMPYFVKGELETTLEVKDGEQTRNLTDEETAIYNSWIESEAKDTGVNIMDGDI